MAFISSTDVTTAMSGVEEQFNFYSRPITIYKQAVQNIVSQPTNVLYGYEPDAQSTNSEITYTSVSSIVSGLVIYPFKNRNSSNQGYIDNKIVLDPNKTYVKLKVQGKNYLMNGDRTEKLEFDGQTWNLDSQGYQVQTFHTLNYYYFDVKGTN